MSARQPSPLQVEQYRWGTLYVGTAEQLAQQAKMPDVWFAGPAVQSVDDQGCQIRVTRCGRAKDPQRQRFEVRWARSEAQQHAWLDEQEARQRAAEKAQAIGQCIAAMPVTPGQFRQQALDRIAPLVDAIERIAAGGQAGGGFRLDDSAMEALQLALQTVRNISASAAVVHEASLQQTCEAQLRQSFGPPEAGPPAFGRFMAMALRQVDVG